MKQHSVPDWLIPLIAVLAVIVAGVGLFSQGGDGPFSFTTVHGNTIEIYGIGYIATTRSLSAVSFAAQMP